MIWTTYILGALVTITGLSSYLSQSTLRGGLVSAAVICIGAAIMLLALLIGGAP